MVNQKLIEFRCILLSYSDVSIEYCLKQMYHETNVSLVLKHIQINICDCVHFKLKILEKYLFRTFNPFLIYVHFL